MQHMAVALLFVGSALLATAAKGQAPGAQQSIDVQDLVTLRDGEGLAGYVAGFDGARLRVEEGGKRRRLDRAALDSILFDVALERPAASFSLEAPHSDLIVLRDGKRAAARITAIDANIVASVAGEFAREDVALILFGAEPGDFAPPVAGEDVAGEDETAEGETPAMCWMGRYAKEARTFRPAKVDVNGSFVETYTPVVIWRGDGRVVYREERTPWEPVKYLTQVHHRYRVLSTAFIHTTTYSDGTWDRRELPRFEKQGVLATPHWGDNGVVADRGQPIPEQKNPELFLPPPGGYRFIAPTACGDDRREEGWQVEKHWSTSEHTGDSTSLEDIPCTFHGAGLMFNPGYGESLSEGYANECSDKPRFVEDGRMQGAQFCVRLNPGNHLVYMVRVRANWDLQRRPCPPSVAGAESAGAGE